MRQPISAGRVASLKYIKYRQQVLSNVVCCGLLCESVVVANLN